MNQDLEHIRLLSVFHYVLGGLAALFACIPFIHFFLGIGFMSGWFEGTDPEAQRVGFFLTSIAAIFILVGWGFAFAIVMAGRFLSQRRNYTYCLVVAGVSCIFMPFGTVLGVFTIIVLVRPSVKQLFEGQPAAPAERST
jgi:hypothetical protein